MKIKKDIKGFLPFIVILLGLTYTILYVLNVPYVRGINMSIVNSALICVGIELAFYLNTNSWKSLVKTRSNKKHEIEYIIFFFLLFILPNNDNELI